MADPRLDEAHRRAIGSRLGRLVELMAELRRLDPPADSLAELESSVRRFAEETRAVLPAAPPHRREALLAEALVLAHELEPRRLQAYGKLTEQQADFLHSEASRLAELIEGSLDDLRGG